MKNKKVVFFTLVLLVVGFIAAIMAYQNSVDKKNQELVANKNGAPFIRDHSISFGENQNKVIITEFLDPECEACAYYYPSIKKVYKEYYEEIRLVIRYLANHQNSEFAVKILESSRVQNKYTEVLEVIFSTQEKWAKHGDTRPELLWQFLSKIEGLDIEKLKKDVSTIDIKNLLSKDRLDAAKLKVTGTPSVFVNGKKAKDLSYDGIVNLVESEIYK